MNEKELKALTDQINAELAKITAIDTELRKEIAKKAPAERIDELINKAAAYEVSVKKLSDQLDALELKLKDRKIGGQSVSLFSDYEKAWKDKGKMQAKAPNGIFTYEIKGNPKMLLKASVIDEATELSDSSLTTAVIVPMPTPGVEKLPDRKILIIDAMARGVTASNRVSWVERSARTDATAALAQNAQYPQGDLTYIRKFAEIEKIGEFIKVTNESLEDWDELLTQIKNELFPSVERALENECYQGDGTTPNLDGIITTAKGYTSTSLNASITSPNNFDCIRAAVNQLDEYNYMANFAFLAPADFAKMDMAKDNNGAYVMPPFSTQGGMVVAGLRVVPSNLVTTGQVLVGDFTKVTLYIKRGIEVKIWDQDSTDPEYDLKTITASVRAAVKFPTVHQYAFVYETLADIKSAIELIV